MKCLTWTTKILPQKEADQVIFLQTNDAVIFFLIPSVAEGIAVITARVHPGESNASWMMMLGRRNNSPF